MNPDYQRNPIWVKSQKQLLIDSIFNDIDVPKIYFRKVEDKFEVVDGQQRLDTVFSYIADGFKMPKDADRINDLPIANLYYSEIAPELQILFNNAKLDIVHLIDYSDEDVEEMFLRLQNGTPLKAAEKRRAIQGNMRDVVSQLADHDVFQLCQFTNHRFDYEDAVAKTLHLLLAGKITDIKPNSIQRTYEQQASITDSDREVKRLKKAFNFIAKAFAGKQNPNLRKYSILSLAYLVAEMLDLAMDLAIEFPIYQRKSIIAYYEPALNTDTIPMATTSSNYARFLYLLEMK